MLQVERIVCWWFLEFVEIRWFKMVSIFRVFNQKLTKCMVSLVFSSLYVIFTPQVVEFSFLTTLLPKPEMEALEVCRSDVLAQKQLTSRVVQHFLERGESWMVGWMASCWSLQASKRGFNRIFIRNLVRLVNTGPLDVKFPGIYVVYLFFFRNPQCIE